MIQIILTYLLICFAAIYSIVGLYNILKPKKKNKCGTNCNCSFYKSKH